MLCGIREHMHIEMYERRAAWALDQQLQVVIMQCYLNSYTTKNLKNKDLKQYCMHYYVTLSNVFQLMYIFEDMYSLFN